jgi:hypothetical protein
MIDTLLAESAGQSGEPAHLHPHSEILALQAAFGRYRASGTDAPEPNARSILSKVKTSWTTSLSVNRALKIGPP